ncbi:WcbI family polysaccharide biosynthesis putative acetyltransferase [Fundidesulfovibrio soli]|uniref:WcbI family polysaccharide biosynthesis putative acetyltransferase n=1 Tax=Fundidesulfovibrio soli TaxID=2922716 RepID=UPI001FAE7A6C|nr:WcbI family polysaccharide biosynthesis putative acetyltransferase [Fundidesulfovibrio soli]
MEDGKRLCILHGNCQGEILAALLSASPEFSAAYRVEFYVNFTRQAIPEASLSRCALLLHQHLGEQWGDLASGFLKSRLPAGARALCYPNMFFKGYWPFWSGKAGIDFRDSMLDSLLDRGLPPSDVMRMALSRNLPAMFGLQDMLAETFAREEAKQALCDVPYLDVLRRGYRAERLFNTINHPRTRLMLHAADAGLELLGMPPLPEEFRSRCPELFAEFELPINPRVAECYGLAFAGEDTPYNVFGTPMRYMEYAALYVDCRLAGRGDFIAYLQGN